MTGVQAYLTMTGGSFDTDLVTERIGLAPDILRRREAGSHGEVSTEWGIRTELEISHNDEVEPVLRSLLSRIPCGPQVLCDTARECSAVWSIRLILETYDWEAPIIIFYQDILQYAAQIHADISVEDSLYMTEEPEDDFEAFGPLKNVFENARTLTLKNAFGNTQPVMKAYLTLIGDSFDTGLVTKQIGMTPDKLRRLDEVLGNGMLFGHTEWGIATELEVCDHVGPLLRKLFDRIPCCSQALYEVARTHTAEWHILILVKMYEKKFPALYFPRDVIRYIAQLHGAIGFDDYFLF